MGIILAIGFLDILVGFFVPPALILMLVMVGALSVIGYLLIIIAAFQEGVAHGLLCLLFGPYTLIFAILHYDEVRTTWLMWAIALGVLIITVCVGVALDILFGSRPRHLQIRPDPEARPAIQWIAAV